MRKISMMTLLAALAMIATLAVFTPARAEDGGCDHCGMKDMHAEKASMTMNHGEIQGKVDANGKASGPTMGAVYTADALYTCPMHKQVVTDNPEAKCPLCNMNLVKMSDEDVAKLRASDPVGCPMDPIVKADKEGAEQRCEICKMKLRTIPEPKQEMQESMR